MAHIDQQSDFLGGEADKMLIAVVGDLHVDSGVTTPL
jgi:hypothetical protein